MIIEENFSRLRKDIAIQMQDAHRAPTRQDQREKYKSRIKETHQNDT